MGYTIGSVSSYDKRALEKVNALLIKEGIRRDANLDYTCAVFDDDYNVIATGSCFRNTLRCMAVDSSHQGEGLMNMVVSHLTEVQFERGYSSYFLYTKPSSAKFFLDLGFHEIARTDSIVFTESRKNGFENWLNEVGQTNGGEAASIVMNANPFTMGHRYLVEKASKENRLVHLFLLSEEEGPIPFAVRKHLVSEGIKDLKNVVLHDSGPYIISSATFPSYFLKDEDSAITAHAELDLAVFGKIADALNITSRYAGSEKASRVTSLYNTRMAEKLPEYGIKFIEVERLVLNGQVVSASTVRQAIHDGKLKEYAFMLAPSTLAFFESEESQSIRKAICAMDNPRHY